MKAIDHNLANGGHQIDLFASGSEHAYESDVFDANWSLLTAKTYVGDGPAVAAYQPLLAEFHVSQTIPPSGGPVIDHHLLTSPVLADLYSGWALT